MSNNIKKHWTKDETCNLIKAYQNYPCLWNQQHVDFKNRLKKRDAFEELGKTLDVPVHEVERKVANINSQYRRERRNYKEHEKSGEIHNFQAKWFGYNLMSFLHGKYEPKVGKEIEFEDSYIPSISEPSLSEDETEIKPFINQIQDTTVNDSEEINFEEASGEGLPKSKRLKGQSSGTKDVTSDANATKNHIERKETETKDEYDVFGDLVARKIRNLKTTYTRHTLQNVIMNLLYQAELGRYDTPPLYENNSAMEDHNSHLPASTSLLNHIDLNSSYNETNCI